MRLWESYKLRLRRRRLILRALRKSRELKCVQNNTKAIGKSDIILVSTMRNEAIRIPFFLQYYRDMGVNHFLFIDNGSADGVRALLADQSDVSIWHTRGSYRVARFGVAWMTALQRRYCHGHWTLVVDPDEFLVYPFCDTRPLRALTEWLDGNETRSFSAMLLDMYPKGKLTRHSYQSGQNPMEIAKWFDAGNYTISRNQKLGNLWIQGGPRARKFFDGNPQKAPALNKIPLVKWHRNYVYTSSTHSLLPRGLNQVYETSGGERACGMLLHTKFLNTLTEKAAEELERREHYAGGAEYAAYAKALRDHPDLWTKSSEAYISWHQLETLGLMSKGSWA